MKKFFTLLLLGFILWSTGIAAYGSSSAEPQKSDINFKMEKSDGNDAVNYRGALVSPATGEALLVINGKFLPGSLAVVQDGVSFIPLRVVHEELGASMEWDEGNEDMQIINGSRYVTAKFVADVLDCALQFNRDVVKIPIVSIEQKNGSTLSVTADEAVGMVKGTITTILRLHYGKIKSNQDLDLFLSEIAFRTVSPSMGRFYRVEIHFYDQWAKRFESQAYIDSYTKQVYIGDSQYGLTDDLLPYLVQKYENHLPMENRNTRVIPFSRITISEDSPFVLVNFPEQIPGNALLETYYNRVDKIKSGRVFVSHKNASGQTIDYIIRFKNETDTETTLSLIEDKGIHNAEKEYQDQMQQAHMERFYRRKLSNRSTEVLLFPGEAYDTAVTNIMDEQFFTALLDFTSSNNLSVTVFAVASGLRDEEESYRGIPSPVLAFDYAYIPKTYKYNPHDPEKTESISYYTTYSGMGAGYRLAVDGIVRASEMSKEYASGLEYNIAFETGGSPQNINQRNGHDEIVEIELFTPHGENHEITRAVWMGSLLAGANGEKEDPNDERNYGNLGNWSVEYDITVQIINDTDEDKIFRCELVPIYQTTWAFVVGGNGAATNVNNKKYSSSFNRKLGTDYDQIHIGSGTRSGHVGEIHVKAGETREFKYAYTLGTDCESNVFHIWTSINE